MKFILLLSLSAALTTLNNATFCMENNFDKLTAEEKEFIASMIDCDFSKALSAPLIHQVAPPSLQAIDTSKKTTDRMASFQKAIA